MMNCFKRAINLPTGQGLPCALFCGDDREALREGGKRAMVAGAMKTCAPPPFRRWQIAALGVFFAALFASRIIQINDHDVFLHARSGRWILEHRAVPRADPFSLFAAGQPWVDHQWLAQVLIALGSDPSIGGFAALGLIRAALLALSYALGLWAMRERGASFWPALMALGLGSMAAWRYSEPRPYVITYLLMAWMAWAWSAWRRRGSKALYAAPAVMLLWANCHGAVGSGIAYLGALAAGQTLASISLRRDKESWASAWKAVLTSGGARRALGEAARATKWIWMALGASVVAACANPYGLAILRFPFKVMGVELFEQVVFEWNPPALEFDFWPYYAYVALLGAAFAARPRSIGAADWIASAGFVWLAWTSRRHIPLLVYTTAPILAEQLEAWRRCAGPRWAPRFLGRRWRAPRWGEAAAAALFLWGGLWTRRMLALDYIPFGLGVNPQAQPAKALDFIESSGREPNLFHSYNWGGFIAWRLGSPWRAFIDGRVDLYGAERTGQYFQWVSGRGDWRRAFDLYDIRTVLLDYEQAQGALGKALWGAPDWALAHWDDLGVVYARRNEDSAQAIAATEYRQINPVWSYKEMTEANPPGPEREAAMAELDRRLQADPDSIRAMEFKSFFLSIEGRLDESAALCRRMIEIEPRAATAQFRLGTILEKLGSAENLSDPEKRHYLQEAERSYRGALRFKPDLAEAWVRLGAICERRGDLKGALGRYRRAMKARPGDADGLYNAARALALLGRTWESIGLWERYLTAKPAGAPLLIDVAGLYEQVGASADALRLMKRAVALDEGRAQTLLALAGLFARYGLWGEAQERLMEAAREMGPGAVAEAEKSKDFAPILADPAWRAAFEAAAREAETGG